MNLGGSLVPQWNLERVFLSESVPIHTVFQCFGGKKLLDLTWTQAVRHLSPRVCCQLTSWWEVRLEMERLRTGLGYETGFPSAQWLLAPYRCGLSPGCWSTSFEVGLKVLPLSVCLLSLPKVTQFSLSVCFSSPSTGILISREGASRTVGVARSYASSLSLCQLQTG